MPSKIVIDGFISTKHPLWTAWKDMKARCNNPSHKDFVNYGARGIKVCNRWETFSNFAKDMGPKPSKAHSLDRIKLNQGYTPLNCRWATRFEQNINRRCWAKSGEKHIHKQNDKWVVRINRLGVLHQIGVFNTIATAKTARNKYLKELEKTNGFSLTELLVVLALLGILSALALSTLYPVMMTMLYGG